MAHLPDDILYMVCSQLWQKRDFNTLFNCACTGKQLATMAVKHLYRMQYVVNTTYGGSDEEKRISCNRVLLKRTGLWRTIILSSLGKTLYPYSQHIRTLELQNLKDLLSRLENRGEMKSKADLFQGELAHFRVDKQGSLHTAETITRIGETITKQTPLLEVLTVDVSNGALSRWIPRLPRLKSLKPIHEATIEGIGNLIRLHCPSFIELHLAYCNSDQDLAAFLNELRPQSLQLFEFFNSDCLGPESFQALSSHGNSLIELNLDMISSTIIPNILLLKSCTNLVSLSLASSMSYTDVLEKPHNDAFLETLAWLKECNKLRKLCFLGYFSAPALMASIFLETNIRLTSLHYEGLVMEAREARVMWSDPDRTSEQSLWLMRDTRGFHQALVNQTSLQWLQLKGDVDQYGWEADILVKSLSKLVNLTCLHLKEISNYFGDEHIVQLASSLPKLVVWSTKGQGLTDAIWGEVASLRSLERLSLDASTCFTADGILDFIEALGPGNKGLNLSVMNAAIDSDLSEEEQKLIKSVIAKTVEGRFEFTLRSDLDWPF